MDIRNCRKCGGVFTYDGHPICAKCRKEEEEDFKMVKDYLYDHPKSTLIEISRELEISVEKVKRFLKEGRLEIIGDSNILLECENCGRSIRSGRYCDECQRNTMNGLRSAAHDLEGAKEEQSSKKQEGGFFFKNKNKDKK